MIFWHLVCNSKASKSTRSVVTVVEETNKIQLQHEANLVPLVPYRVATKEKVSDGPTYQVCACTGRRAQLAKATNGRRTEWPPPYSRGKNIIGVKRGVYLRSGHCSLIYVVTLESPVVREEVWVRMPSEVH